MHCGRRLRSPLTAGGRERRYCSATCGRLWRGLEADRVSSAESSPRVCAHCGGEFRHGNRGRMYCGNRCRQLAQNRKCDPKYQRAVADRNAARPCLHCGAPRGGGPRKYCEACRASGAAQADLRLRSRYGVTLKWKLARVAAVGGCEMCGGPFGGHNGACVDHCSVTGAVRGVLCDSCNLILGNAKDDASILQAGVDYLARGGDFREFPERLPGVPRRLVA